MPTRKTLQLDQDSRAQLQHVVKRGSYWRERERAQTLLLLDSGVFAEDVARQMGLNVRTVRITHTLGARQAWPRWPICRAAAHPGSSSLSTLSAWCSGLGPSP